MFTYDKLTESFEDVLVFLKEERAKSLSHAEWKFRMRGYGYNLRRTDNGVEIARLPQNAVLGVMPV